MKGAGVNPQKITDKTVYNRHLALTVANSFDIQQIPKESANPNTMC